MLFLDSQSLSIQDSIILKLQINSIVNRVGHTLLIAVYPILHPFLPSAALTDDDQLLTSSP